MYGVDLHPVMGEDNVEYFLGLTPSGVIVLKNKAKVSNYFWPRITKVYFKGKYFMLRVRDKTNDENTYGFELPSKQACKYLWKCCVEHHAFFRLTQVKELPGHPINIFSLGSKYRYSGRTEQQIRMEMKQLKRSPPTVVRIPSRRYQKRLGEPDGADAGTQGREEVYRRENSDAKNILPVSQTVCSSSLYRSISTPAALSAADSPKSAKSAPWENPNLRGLFPNLSRQSLQSTHASERKHGLKTSNHRRSTSLDSESSWDSRRRKHHKSKRSSDNDSDISKSSRGSRGSKSSRGGSSHRKTRSHSRESGSDSDSYHRRRGRKHSRRSSSKYDLVESDSQWKMVQKQQQEKKSNPRPQNAVVRDLSNRKSGYMNSGIDTESEVTLHHRRKYRRHSRSRSRSPDTKHSLSSDVKKHIEYDLIDPTHMTEEEKKDIKYTKVQTEDNVFKIRCSPASGKNRYKIAKVPSKTSLDCHPPRKPTEDDDPPPPYTPSAVNGNASQENFKQLGWNYEVNATSSASFSTAQISDSSSSSISSALKSREKTVHPVSNSTAIGLKGRSTKQLNGSLQELSSSTHSSGTENSSKNRIMNGNSYNPSNRREPTALIYQKKQNVSSDSKVATGHIQRNHTKQSTDLPPVPSVQSLNSNKSLNQQSQNSHEMSTEL